MTSHIEPMTEKILIGWSEWISLPDLDVPAIRAKIDTGAKTSALHAFNIHEVCVDNTDCITFDIHPIQKNDELIIQCTKPIHDRRLVMSSSGHQEERFVVLTTLTMAQSSWEIELTLSNREPLLHRMLLGRAALMDRVLIDPGHRRHLTRVTDSKLKTLYGNYKSS